MAGTPPCELQRVDAGSDKQLYGGFGTSVAISDDGDYFVVGAAETIDDDDAVGAAYVFHWNGSSWDQQARLTAPDGEAWDQFGSDVDISSDGDYIVVGAHQKGKVTYSYGEAHVFSRSGTTWSHQQELTGNGAVNGSLFGCSVAIDSDGETVIVGAKYDGTTDHEDPPLWKRGEAYIYTRSGSTWTEQANIYADDWDDADDGIIFGAAVDICGDYVVVGAREADCDDDDEGAVYIFKWENSAWDQKHKLYAEYGDDQDWFGFSVAVDGDANTIVVGARQDDDEGTDAGAAYVFTKNILGVWSQHDKVTASDGSGGDHFGRRVAIASDGASILVGAPLTNIIMQGTDFGKAYYYSRDTNSWSEDFIIEADDKAKEDQFGLDVCMSADGEYAVITSWKDDVGLFFNAGSAYVEGLTSTACP
jgi:hypothetical protein